MECMGDRARKKRTRFPGQKTNKKTKNKESDIGCNRLEMKESDMCSSEKYGLNE